MRLHQNTARTGDDAPGGFARVFALPRARKNQKRSEETVPFQVARPGPNHNLMFCLTKDLQVAEIKCHYCWTRSEEHTSELQSRFDRVCRLLLQKNNLGDIDFDKRTTCTGRWLKN